MIKLTDKDKTLVIPSGLGFGGQSSGSGGGVTPEEAAEIASAVTAEALDEYDTELQVDLEEIREAVSANTQDIAILSGLSTDIAAISGQTTANTQDIGILSGVTEDLQGGLSNLETFVQGDLQGAIAAAGGLAESANTKVDALSAVTSALTQTVAGKQDALTAGNGISILGTTISVKAGDGLGFSGDTLVVSGGTGGVQNYVIVDVLGDIASPVEGMLAYVKYRRMNGWILDASQITEGYVANVYYDGSNSTSVYRSGTNFHWNWNNSATDWVYANNIWYKIDTENAIFYAACEDPNAYITVESGVVSASTVAQMDIDQLYLYNGTAWEAKNFPPTDIYFENMTAGERADLYDEITDLLGGDSGSGNLPKLFSKYRFFTSAGQIDGQTVSEVYFSNFESGENTRILFVGSKMTKMSYPVDIYRVGVILSEDGSIQTSVDSFRDSLNNS